MTWQEYENRKKFINEEHIYPKTSTFGIGSIFETHHLRTGKSIYLKVVYATDDFWGFNLTICDKKGNFLCSKKRGCWRNEIIAHIEENDWRLYKQYFGKRELIPKVKGYLAPKRKKNIPNRN